MESNFKNLEENLPNFVLSLFPWKQIQLADIIDMIQDQIFRNFNLDYVMFVYIKIKNM